MPKLTALLLTDVIVFVVACCLPALQFKNSNGVFDVMLGLRALVVGWSGIFAGVIAWYANLFFGTGLLFALLRKPLLATAASVIAVAIACTTFSLVGRELPADEGMVNKTAVVAILPGCYVWIASMVFLPLAAYLGK